VDEEVIALSCVWKSRSRSFEDLGMGIDRRDRSHGYIVREKEHGFDPRTEGCFIRWLNGLFKFFV
jgi:hypothetical protein